VGSLEDRARANVAAQRAADEERARQAQREEHNAAQLRGQQMERETPLRTRSLSALAEFVQLAKTRSVPAFELQRARVVEQRKGWRGTYTRMTYEPIARAWVMTPKARQWGSYSTALAVTEDARIFEFIGCLDRLGGGKKKQTLYLVYNDCAKAFHLGNWWNGRPIDEQLRVDSGVPLDAWEIDPLKGQATFENYLRPWNPDDLLTTMLSDIGAHAGMVLQQSRDSSYTWAEAMAEVSATAILSGMYNIPRGQGHGDSKAAAEQ
jgi:hypothetical protein